MVSTTSEELEWRDRLRNRALAWRRRMAAVITPRRLHVVSAAYNAEKFIERHLSSLQAQRYPSWRFRHTLIDDASTDDTLTLVERFAKKHPKYRLEIIRNDLRRGGCANYTHAFRQAEPGSIVLQVDADDWLPDDRVLEYVNWIYRDRDVWMTYNSWVYPDGRPCTYNGAISDGYRENPWISSHLHSFRAELFEYVRDDSLIDPKTGEFWQAAVDMSHYLPMLELAGSHARHIDRPMYVYNFHGESIGQARRDEQLACEARIRGLESYEPLKSLFRRR